MSDLLYIEKVPASERLAFAEVVNAVAKNLGMQNPNWLMQVIHAESAGTFSPSIQNPKTKATGLIQFMPATAIGLGTTVEALKKMSRVQQMAWVQKYFWPYRNRLNSYYDVYLVVFFPAAIGKPDNWIMQTSKLSPEIIAKQNPAINIQKDGKITVAEFKEYLQKTVPAAFRNIVFKAAGIGITAFVLFGILFLIANK